MLDKNMDVNEIEYWLKQDSEDELEKLWRQADCVRKEYVGDAVHLRGLVELSNVCVRSCKYCGLRADNRKLVRYRMSRDEILLCVKDALKYGYGTVVFQAGEDYGIKTEWLSDVIAEIKSTTGLAVTLSMGERSSDDIIEWKKAGADRYLLRFETSDKDLYNKIHPPINNEMSDRLEILEFLKNQGYETGGGVMIGIPGQIYSSLAEDISIFREFDLDMIGVGPFISNPDTPAGSGEIEPADWENQVPNSELMVYKVVALTRIVCPEANIPSTTALATINKVRGREFGLMRGANVVMPNLTPPKYRVLYEIYPGKACINETALACSACLKSRIESIGRFIGAGPGNRTKAAVT